MAVREWMGRLRMLRENQLCFVTCWWSLKRARGAQGSEVDFKRGGRDGRDDVDDVGGGTITDPLTSDWLWRPVDPLARLRSSSSLLSSSRRRSRISVFSLRGGANSDEAAEVVALLRNSNWDALRLNSVKLTDSSLASAGSLRCRPVHSARELNNGSGLMAGVFGPLLMTMASAESDSLRLCIRGGVAAEVAEVTPPPELLLELVLFSSVGSSLLLVPASLPLLAGLAFQLGKNWAKSQSFSIYFPRSTCSTFNNNTSRASDR